MAASFIETFQNLANSITSGDTINCFTWDKAIRKFQYTIAGIMLATLTIFESTTSMECSSPVDNDYAGSYCREAKWYYVGNSSTGHQKPYDEFLRYFKWYILIPPIFTIVFAAIYGSFVNGHLIQALKSAARIKGIWDSRLEDPVTFDESSDVNQIITTMAMCSRLFAESNLPYRQKDCRSDCCCCFLSRYSKDGNEDRKIEEEQKLIQEIFDDPSDDIEQQSNRHKVRLGQKTACYFNMYLLIMFIVNVLAVIFFNPLIFSFPRTIACTYRNKDLIYHWSICSVPGHRYARVAIIIIMINHAIGALSSLLSLIYLHIFIPCTILTADSVIEDYTRRVKLQQVILNYWSKNGRKKIKTLTATSKFILALIYQNIGRLLCFRLILALVDIEKDEDTVDTILEDLIKNTISSQNAKTKEESVNEIREIILNPLSVDMMRDKIQSKRLKHLVAKITAINRKDVNADKKKDIPADNKKDTNVDKNKIESEEVLRAQQIQRIAGVQLPKLTQVGKNKFDDLIRNANRDDFFAEKDYFIHIAALYDLSKSDVMFDEILKDKEIGHLQKGEQADKCYKDNGNYGSEKGPQYSAKNAFDTSGFCWRSHNLTSYSSIQRIWGEAHSIDLIALQASHLYERATPTKFQFFANLNDDPEKEDRFVDISEMYWSYDWMKDEWRFFSVNMNKVPDDYKNKIKSVQIQIHNNGGEKFIEIQKIKIYGKKVSDAPQPS